MTYRIVNTNSLSVFPWENRYHVILYNIFDGYWMIINIVIIINFAIIQTIFKSDLKATKCGIGPTLSRVGIIANDKLNKCDLTNL